MVSVGVWAHVQYDDLTETVLYPDLRILALQLGRRIGYASMNTCEVYLNGQPLDQTMKNQLVLAPNEFARVYLPRYTGPLVGGYLTVRESFGDSVALMYFMSRVLCPYCGNVHQDVLGNGVVRCRQHDATLTLEEYGPLRMVSVDELLASEVPAFFFHNMWAQPYLVGNVLPRGALQELQEQWRQTQ